MRFLVNQAARALAVSAFAVGIIALAPSSQAASLSGEWVGGGFIEPRSGTRERVRCRVRYSRISRNVFSVSARCASPSGALNQTGEVVRVRANRYVGDFYNAQFNESGRARVIVQGRRQSVTVTTGSGRGRLTLRKR